LPKLMPQKGAGTRRCPQIHYWQVVLFMLSVHFG